MNDARLDHLKRFYSILANLPVTAFEARAQSWSIAGDRQRRRKHSGDSRPTVHEMKLWVQAGLPPSVALQAATFNSARLLRAENHIGSFRTGNDADLLPVDGNPLEDITAAERISLVVFKGERIDRSDLFDQH